MKRYLLIGSLFVVLVGGALTAFFYFNLENRKSRISLLNESIKTDKYELAQGILWGLIGDYPGDPEILTFIQQMNDYFEAERVLNGKRWADVSLSFDQINQSLDSTDVKLNRLQSRLNSTQTELSSLRGSLFSFRTSVDTFQTLEREQWVQQALADDVQVSNDFLFQLLKENKVSTNQLSSQELDRTIQAATLALESNNYTLAKSESAKVLRNNPINATAATIWSFAVVVQAPENADNVNRILPVMEFIIKGAPNNLLALKTAGMIYFATGNYALAEERYRKAYEVSRGSFENQKNYVSALVKNGKQKDGLEIALAIWKESQKTDEIGILVWQCLQNQDDGAKEAFLREWRQNIGQSPLPDTYLGELANSQGRLQVALDAFYSAEQKRPSLQLYKRIAEVNLEMGNKLPAIKYLQSLITRLNPRTSSGRDDFVKYGYILIKTEFELKMYSDALNEIQSYLKINPDYGPVRFLQAQSYANLNDPKTATQIYEDLYKRGEYKLIAIPLLDLNLRLMNFDFVVSRGRDLISKIEDTDLHGAIKQRVSEAEESIAKGKR